MRGFNSILVLTLSFVSLALSGPLHSNIHSPFARSPVPSRQFHYRRALFDTCANVDLSAAGLSGEICLCLSTLNLDLDANVNLKTTLDSVSKVYLETVVGEQGTQCTYPDHASPKCSPGNPCDFTCTDGFVKQGGSCVCPSPNSVCNGKCGSYPNGCSSALPRAPRMTRKGILSRTTNINLRGPNPSSGSSGLNLGESVNGLLNSLGITLGGDQSSGSDVDIDVDTLVEEVLNLLGLGTPISGVDQSADLEVVLQICLGTGTQNLLDTVTNIVNSLLSSLLGNTLSLEVDSSCSASADSNTLSLGLQICGTVGDSLEATLNNVLDTLGNLLSGLLDGVNVVVTGCSVGGPGCPATSTSSSSNLLPSSSVPHSSSVTAPQPTVSPSPSPTLDGTDLSGLVDTFLGEVDGILSDLGLSSANLNLVNLTDSTVDVSVGLDDALSSSLDAVVRLVDGILDDLLDTNVAIQPTPDPTTTPTSGEGNGCAINIDLALLLSATLTGADDIVNAVSLAVAQVLADFLDTGVSVNVNGGSSCGCSASKEASPQN